jgi:hypothetical protein
VYAVPVHAGPAERREQGRVDVQDAPAVALDDGGRHQLEVAREHQQLHAVRLEHREPLGAIAMVREADGGDAAHPRPIERGHVGAMGEHAHHLRIAPIRERRQERLEVAPPARNRYRNSHRHRAGR